MQRLFIPAGVQEIDEYAFADTRHLVLCAPRAVAEWLAERTGLAVEVAEEDPNAGKPLPKAPPRTRIPYVRPADSDDGDLPF